MRALSLLVFLVFVCLDVQAAQPRSVDVLTARSLEQATAFAETFAENPAQFWNAFCDEVSSSTLTIEEQRDVFHTALRWSNTARISAWDAWSLATPTMRRMLMLTVESISDSQLLAIVADQAVIEERRRRARLRD